MSGKAVLPKLQEMYRTAPIRAFMRRRNGCCGTWKQEAWLKQVNEEWAKDKEQREKRLERHRAGVGEGQGEAPPQWYVNGQGQTMVVIPGPVEFLMGSPPTEAGQAGRRGAAQEADRSDVCPRRQAGDGGAIPAFRRGPRFTSRSTHPTRRLPGGSA